MLIVRWSREMVFAKDFKRKLCKFDFTKGRRGGWNKGVVKGSYLFGNRFFFLFLIFYRLIFYLLLKDNKKNYILSNVSPHVDVK